MLLGRREQALLHHGRGKAHVVLDLFQVFEQCAMCLESSPVEARAVSFNPLRVAAEESTQDRHQCFLLVWDGPLPLGHHMQSTASPTEPAQNNVLCKSLSQNGYASRWPFEKRGGLAPVPRQGAPRGLYPESCDLVKFPGLP